MLGLVYAQQTESFTITTYYPSPYGSYRQLQADQIAIGSGYRNPAYSDGTLYVEGSVGIGTMNPRTTQDARPLRLDVVNNIVTDDVYLANPRTGDPRWASAVGGGCNWTGWRCVCGADTGGGHEGRAVIAFQCLDGTLNDIRFRSYVVTGGNTSCPATAPAGWGCDSYVRNNF